MLQVPQTLIIFSYSLFINRLIFFIGRIYIRLQSGKPFIVQHFGFLQQIFILSGKGGNLFFITLLQRFNAVGIFSVCNLELLIILCRRRFKFPRSLFFRFRKFILKIGNAFTVTNAGVLKRIFNIFGKIRKTSVKRRFNRFYLTIKLLFISCNIIVRFFIEFFKCIRLSAFGFFCSTCKKIVVFTVQFGNFSIYIKSCLLKLHAGTPYCGNGIFRSNTGIV